MDLGATQIFFMFTPKLGEMIPNLTISYFSNGLVQPPTNGSYDHVSFFRSFTGHFPENPIMPGVLQVEAKSRRRFFSVAGCFV